MPRYDVKIKDVSIGCQCDQFSVRNMETCNEDEIRSGLCMNMKCSPLCPEMAQSSSIDGQSCVACDDHNSSSLAEGNTIIFDDVNSECVCNNPLPTSQPSNRPVLNSKMIEIYHPNTGEPVRKECVPCPKNTAVVTEKLLQNGELRYSTLGKSFYPDPTRCVHCPDPNMYFDTDYKCKCLYGYIVVGHASVGPMKCLKLSPKLSSNFATVSFPFLSTKGTFSKEMKSVSINSIIFSHYYLYAASQCEFPTADSLERSTNACQTLANLCVMSYYDDESTPCQQYKFVANKRILNYNNQDEWKALVPWLYYSDEVDDIVEYKGIHMTLSLTQSKENEQLMFFKVAKYTLDGQFLGMENLTNQLIYCNSMEQNKAVEHLGFKFGHKTSYQFQCSIDSILKTDMLFYDLYLVDKDCIGTPDSMECLYPIPVLNKNLIENGDKLPNDNEFFGDEIDDTYVRRFFLFDNMVRLLVHIDIMLSFDIIINDSRVFL